ncbi:hypothetical protein AB205_0157250 [Aquarana catesbeiana]|uniref:Uncharacterized protein n=1 Tax=Aquarana catesbeiana TaxID=8400 RepID=A0A2G9P3U1_AQUCT|nr:hypothetical protein AB205_0157250 [Aquarana catesbeiana]
MWRKERFMKWVMWMLLKKKHISFVSAQVLIREIMVCNLDLQKIKEDINDIEKRFKNIIDVLGKIKNTPTFIKFFLFF